MARHKITNQKQQSAWDQVDPVVGAMTHGVLEMFLSTGFLLCVCIITAHKGAEESTGGSMME